MITETDGEYYPGRKWWFWRCLFSSIRLIFRYRRYVLIATDIERDGKEYTIEMRYCGLNPAGFKHILREAADIDDRGEEVVQKAKDIIQP